MEARLAGRDVTLVLVTHDRAFLEALSSGLLELEAGAAHMHAFGGDGCYDRYRAVSLLLSRSSSHLGDFLQACGYRLREETGMPFCWPIVATEWSPLRMAAPYL